MSRADDFAIEVTDLTKRYRMGVYDTNLRETIVDGWRRATRALAGEPPPPRLGDYWALKGVSFTIPRGEIVGVIGHNGAGKSTLLKILSRITEPTAGSVRFRGRVASLLEVGAGFDPELTGRDNVFLEGAILGMTHAEIARRFDEIVEFSGVGAFIDTPVKRYSSGMYMRLAFAVAAHLEANILLVDEVLAVGDFEFQQKCLARIDELAGGGRTVLLVSHNIVAVQSLCKRCLLFDHGRLVADGPTRQVIAAYLAKDADGSRTRQWSAEDAPRNSLVALRGLRVEAVEGERRGPLDITRPFRIVLEHERLAQGGNPIVSLLLHDSAGVLVFDTSNHAAAPAEPGLYRETCVVPGDLLNAGRYTLSVALHSDDEVSCELPNLIGFDLLDSDRDRRGWYGEWKGILRPRFDWGSERLDAPLIAPRVARA
jgi:lipopolysaccharide transport system ATP-binding protein